MISNPGISLSFWIRSATCSGSGHRLKANVHSYSNLLYSERLCAKEVMIQARCDNVDS